MLNLIKDNWTEVLSLIGAAAWLPIIFTPLIRCIANRICKIQATLLDSRILLNGKGESVEKKQTKYGTILMLAINVFYKRTTLFARNISVKVKLKNGAKLNTELLDFSTLTENGDDTKSSFSVPISEEFNVSRTIHPNVDNIKYIAVLVESAIFKSIDEIDEIEIRLFYRGIKCAIFSKKITIKSSDFPTFNSARMIDKVEEIYQKK